MNKDAKFILFKDDVFEHIVLFDCALPHDQLGIKNVTAAGFVDLKEKVCHGESVNLGIGSNERANDFLRMLLK